MFQVYMIVTPTFMTNKVCEFWPEIKIAIVDYSCPTDPRH